MKPVEIPPELLKLELGEAYNEEKGFYKWTLQSELDALGEPLEAVDWTATKYLPFKILHFHGWTKNYIVHLVETPFGDQVLERIPRHPNTENK